VGEKLSTNLKKKQSGSQKTHLRRQEKVRRAEIVKLRSEEVQSNRFREYEQIVEKMKQLPPPTKQ
jgi:hypothetical protein